MAKVEIIGPKSEFLDLLSLLHEHGKIHVEDLTKKIQTGELPVRKMEIDSEEVRIYDELDESLLRVRAILKTLTEPADGVDAVRRRAEYDRLWALTPDELCVDIRGLIDEVEDRTADLAQLHTAAESELALLSRYEPILSKIQPLAKQIVVTGAFDSVALLIERRYKAGLEALQRELDKITNSQCEIISTDIDENTTAAIVVYGRQFADAVHKFLSMENVNQIRLPQDFQDMPLDEAYQEIRQRKVDLPKELDHIRDELAEMSRKWYTRLSTARDVLVDRIDQIVAIPKFGSTDYAFLIDGWIPVDDLPELRERVKKAFGDEIVISQSAIDQREYENAPVQLKNAAWAEPFQSLLGFMGTPKYGTYDPTWMLAFFYPLFFGMIVGDIGYGAIMLGTVIWLRQKFKDNAGVHIATSVLGPAATSVVFFGFVYGEFFGNLLGGKFLDLIREIWVLGGQFGFGHPPAGALVILPFERTKQEMVVVFLIIAVGVGLIQVLLGLGLGIYNGVRTKHWKHVYEKSGIFAFVVGFVVLILAVVFATWLQGLAAWVQAVGGLLLFVGLVYAIKGGQLLGAIESISALAHVASYLRIMAVGLAGAIFAEAVNGVAQQAGNPVIGLIIAIPLQSLNFIIAAFSPNIHAVRLNFVEFFGNFYEAGTTEYRPFHKSGGEKKA
jgi:V/A-type H+-transporting ATPase subunit I